MNELSTIRSSPCAAGGVDAVILFDEDDSDNGRLARAAFAEQLRQRSLLSGAAS